MKSQRYTSSTFFAPASICQSDIWASYALLVWKSEHSRKTRMQPNLESSLCTEEANLRLVASRFLVASQTKVRRVSSPFPPVLKFPEGGLPPHSTNACDLTVQPYNVALAKENNNLCGACICKLLQKHL